MQLLQSPVWKKVFWILSIALLIVMPSISHNFGQNGDEDVEAQYGQDIYNYYANGDRQALDYDTHPHPSFGANISGQQYYGGMFDLMTESVHRMFPSWNIMYVRHFFASIFGALLMMFTGLLAYRLSRKQWWVAVLALVFIAFSPRIFGESMNNGKDIPFAMGMTMATYYLVRILQDLTVKKTLWKEVLLLALSWGIILGMRSAGGLLFIAYAGLFILLYYLLNRTEWQALRTQKLIGNGLVLIVAAFLIGSVLGFLTWPFGLQSPIKNLFTALKEMSNRAVGIRVLFDGQNYNSMQMPWYYELKWIFISNPIVVLLSAVLFIPLIPKAMKRYSSFAVILLLFSFGFPLFYLVYKNSTVYDTWRQMFFVYPSLVIMAALSIDMLAQFFKVHLKWIPLAAAGLGLLPAIIWTAKSTPYQYIFFNAFVGGASGAFGNYELDYYQATNREMVQWIIRNVPKPKDGKKLIVRSDLDGMNTYFRNDTDWVDARYARYYERNQQDWDYFLTYDRFVSPWQLQHGKWPPAHVVYSVKVDGAPVGVIIKRSSKESYYGYQALQRNDFLTAIKDYSAFLATDSSDEMVYMNYGIALASTGRVDEGIAALKKATLLDASRPVFYKILSQMYQAKGDMDNARKSLMQAQSILAKESMNQ